MNKHLLPTFGGSFMANLTTARMNDFIWQKLNSGRLNGKGGLSAKSVHDIMTVFHSISVYAAREYGIREIYFTMPKTEQKKMEVLYFANIHLLENLQNLQQDMQKLYQKQQDILHV